MAGIGVGAVCGKLGESGGKRERTREREERGGNLRTVAAAAATARAVSLELYRSMAL
jgi:hypothetical protein